MWKPALLMLVVGVTVGALMPAPEPVDGNEVGPRPPQMVAAEASSTSAAPSVAATPTLGGTVALARNDDGHFYTDAQVNGTSINFVVDTGASVVSLTRADAERAGITVDPAQFQVVAQGASGPVMGASVVLNEVSLNGHRVSGLPALVLADSPVSLLGQNYLKQFASVAIENDQMMLR